MAAAAYGVLYPVVMPSVQGGWWWIGEYSEDSHKEDENTENDLRNPALLIKEMLGRRELSVGCLHGEQMFNNRLLSWTDYGVTHLRLNKSRLEIQHNLAVRANDHWNSFTKACVWFVTGTFKSPGNKFYPWICCTSNRSWFVNALILLQSTRSGSPHTPVRSGLFT